MKNFWFRKFRCCQDSWPFDGETPKNLSFEAMKMGEFGNQSNNTAYLDDR